MTHQARWKLFAVVGWSLAVIGGVGGRMVRSALKPTSARLWLRSSVRR